MSKLPSTPFRLPLALLAALLLSLLNAPLHAQKDRDRERDYEAERRQLENLRREVRDLERTITEVDSQIQDRKKQLADAPKTINPAEKALKEAETRQDKAKGVMPDTKKRLDEADAKVVNVLKGLKSQYAGAAELDAAEAKQIEARAKLEEAKRLGVEKLKNDSAYKSAKNRVEISQSRVTVLQEQREAGTGSTADLADASEQLLRYQLELDELEAKVLGSDERYRKAKIELEEADKTLTYLRSQMVEKLKNHTDYSTATASLTAAREKFADAMKEMQEASKTRAEASGTLSKLKAQVKEFERDTERLQSRKEALKSQLRAKERRAEDYARQIGRN